MAYNGTAGIPIGTKELRFGGISFTDLIRRDEEDDLLAPS